MILQDVDVKEIFNLVRKNNTLEYLMRYKKLYLEPKKWDWIEREVPRVIAVMEFEKYVEKYDIKPKRMLSFSAHKGNGDVTALKGTGDEDPELRFLTVEKLYNFNFDDDMENHDLHKLNIPKHNYDFVMFNQFLEHLYNPLMCIENVYSYLEKGAYIYLNVPTLNLIHGYPYNFITGFTPVGLGCLLKQAGFKVLEIGQWGNFDYIDIVFRQNNWPFMPSCPTHNIFDRPCQCWALAQKITD